MKIEDTKISAQVIICCYGVISVAGLIWILLTGKNVDSLFHTSSPLLCLVIAFIPPVCIFLLGIVLTKYIKGLREYEMEFFHLVRGQTKKELFLMALVSAIGEEIFFRGAVQQQFGLLPAAVIFGIAHFPANRKLIPWPFFAFLMGLLLGWQFQYTKNLAVPIITHFCINLSNMLKLHMKYVET